MSRFCASGQHWKPETSFRLTAGKYARDCLACEKKLPPMLGVDIDRIHYKLGAVKRKPAAA